MWWVNLVCEVKTQRKRVWLKVMLEVGMLGAKKWRAADERVNEVQVYEVSSDEAKKVKQKPD